MKDTTVRGLICILAIIYVIMVIVGFEVQVLKYRGREAALTKQICELQAENSELKKTEAVIKDLINTQSDSINSERDKNNRGGDRELRYKLTSAERKLIERVVMAEAGGEIYEGQMLVAQCILDACEIDGIRPAEAVKKYAYARSRPEPSGSVSKAVTSVFDLGETVVDEPVLYFYAPGRVKSQFHESQQFVCQVGGHRFFTSKDKT